MLTPDKIASFLNKDTMIPVGFVVGIIYIAMWATHISDRVEAQSAALSVQEKAALDYSKTVQSIDRRLIRLEATSNAVARRLKVPNDSDE